MYQKEDISEVIIMFKWVKSHKYCLWLLYFLFYLTAFFALERYVTPRYIIECSFDEMIPFCEWFIFPYCLWYLIIPVSLIYFMFKDEAEFKRLCFLMFGGMTASLIIYVLFPNGLELRVDIERNNIAAQLCRVLQGIDTPTNVCPSVHVASAVAIDMAVQKSEFLKNNIVVRIVSFVLMLLISASTVFLKQHSLWDVAAGAMLSVVLLLITYHKSVAVMLGLKK